MTHFPKPDPVNPSRRVKVGSVAVTIRSEGGQPVRAQLHDLSATGGLLILSKAFEQGDFVELAFQTSQGQNSRLGRGTGGTTRINLGLLATFSVRCPRR